MKKNIIKAMAVCGFSALLLCGTFTAGRAYTQYKAETQDKEYLLDFLHYCQGNEGLRQIDPNKDYTKSSLHDLKKLAKFYLEQDNYADVSDYWDVSVIDEIVYPQGNGGTANK